MIYKKYKRTINDGNEDDSKKRINYISHRIKSLEKEINDIKNKETLTLVSPYKKNIIKRNDESKYNSVIKTINDFDFIKTNSLIYDDNDSFDKRKSKLNDRTKPNKKNNNNTERKNIIKKIINSELIRKNQRTKNNIRFRASNDNEKNKIRHFFSFSKPFKYKMGLKKEKLNENQTTINNYNNNREKLQYEFEIRNLKRKMALLKKENNDIKKKLEDIKNINSDIEKDIEGTSNKSKNREKLINNLIALNDNYMKNNNQNELENNQNNDSLYENLVLNVMDIKYFYENNLLTEQFIEGINKLLKKQLLIKNNNDNDNLLKKINEIIDGKNNLENNINKYKYLLKDNHKYYVYYKSLLDKLNLKNFKELHEFIKNIYIDNIKENNHMKKIQNTLMVDTGSPRPKKEPKKRYYSSNKVLNNFTHKIKNNDFNRIHSILKGKNTDSKTKQKSINHYLSNERNHHNLTEKKIFKTEQFNDISKGHIINLNNTNDNKIFNSFYKIDINNNSLLYSEKGRNPYYYKKRRKININDFNNKYYKINGGKNIINTYNKKNDLFNHEDDIGDIKYYNKNNNNKIKNYEINKNLNKYYFEQY